MIKNILWNIAGPGIPLVIALYAIPITLKGYGAEGFSTLSIIFTLVGYLTIFDFGISKAITKYIAESNSLENRRVNTTWYTAFIVIFIMGIFLAIILFLAANLLVSKYLNISKEAIQPTIESFQLASFAIPFSLISVISIGTLEAKNKFNFINIIRIISGSLNFLTPVLLLQFTSSINFATLSLVILKILTSIILIISAVTSLNFKSIDCNFVLNNLKPLFKFGAWVSVSGFISPLLIQLDRFVLATVLPLKQLPNYIIAADMFNRLSFIPSGFMTVFFPFFVSTRKKHGSISIEIYQSSSAGLNFVGLICLLVVSLSSEYLLKIWLKEKYVDDLALIFFIFSTGFYYNCLARIPYTILQSVNRPDIPAKIHIFELVIYIYFLYYMSIYFGVFGAAIAWSARMLIDCLAMYWAAYKKTKLKLLIFDQMIIIFNPILCYLLFISFESFFLRQILIFIIFAINFKNILSINRIMKARHD